MVRRAASPRGRVSVAMVSRSLLCLTAALYAGGSVLVAVRTLARARVGRGWTWAAIWSGFAVHSVAIASRWMETGHFPTLGLPDVMSFLAWSLVLVFSLFSFRQGVEAVALGVYPLAFGLVGLACLASREAQRGELVARSLFLPIHTTLALGGYAALLVACVLGLMYLIQERELKARAPRFFYYLVPSLERCDTLGGLSVAVGFILLTLAIFTGFLWNHGLKGEYWSGDPKEWAALGAWLIYLALLGARRRAGWGGRHAAWLSLVGFGAVTFTIVWVTVLARIPLR